MSNVSEEVVKKILFSLNTSKAVGIYQILAKISEGLARLLGNISNLSIKLSTSAEVYKITELKPIFRKGARTDPKNYRPTFTFATSIENN